MRRQERREGVRRLDKKRRENCTSNLDEEAKGLIAVRPMVVSGLNEDRDESDLESNVFESAAELVKSKGYIQTRTIVDGIDLSAYRIVEVTACECIVDMLLISFHQADGLIKTHEDDYSLRSAVESNASIIGSCRELSEKTKSITSAIIEYTRHPHSHNGQSVSTFIEGVESYSANLLLRRIGFHRYNGKKVGFWISPVLLTSSKMQNGIFGEKPWISASARLSENDVDIVHVSNLASYLELKEKEVKVLGKESLLKEEAPTRFQDDLGRFRLLTLLASLVLLSGFIAYALYPEFGLPLAGLSIISAAIVELLGGKRLFNSYNEINGQSSVTASGLAKINPEQVVAHETEFTPDELSYLYSKYGGAELSKLRKELRHQRIVELTGKGKEIFSKVRKLEAEEFYSEVILSLDRATRSLLAATLLSVGIDIQGGDVTEWIPQLRRTIPNLRLEDMKSLRMLTDKINKGHDATKYETRRAKQIADPIVDAALDYLNRFLRRQSLSQNTATPMNDERGAHISSPTLTEQYNERIRIALLAAYSARSNGETEKFLYNLEQSLAAAVSMKILELSHEPPSALTLPSLLRELENLNFKLDREIAKKWLDKLKNGEISADSEVKGFESFCLDSLERLGVMKQLTGVRGFVFKLGTTRTEQLGVSGAREGQPPNRIAANHENESLANNASGSPIKISAKILDTAQALKFVLDVADNKELSNLGEAAPLLIKAKKTLGTEAAGISGSANDDRPTGYQERSVASANQTLEAGEDEQGAEIGSKKTISEELDSLTKSLGISLNSRGVAQSRAATSSRSSHVGTDAPNQVLEFDNLGDFKKILSYCPIPIVASFLSDDESSNEINEAMRSLVKRYHNRAAFISVNSKSEDIARECRIKSYPAILLLNRGRVLRELKAFEADELEHDLLRALKSIDATESHDAAEEEQGETQREIDSDADTEPAEGAETLEVSDSS